jgi:hypothetical protein
MSSRTNLFTSYLGRDHWGNRLFVEVETEVLDHTVTGTDHRPVAPGSLILSITGWTIRKHTRNTWDSAGQISRLLHGMSETAPGWNPVDISSLKRIWKAYHLNHMRAACEHIEDEANDLPPEYTAREHLTCPESGYRYGRAWLFERVPAEVWQELARLSQLPHDTIVK